MDSPLLSVSNLKIKFEHQTVLDDINFEVKENEILAIIGPNGAGKTVLFRALLGLIPFEGKIEWKPKIKIGYVPQRLTIAKDLPLTTLEFFQLKEKKQREIEKVLTEVGLKESVLKSKIGILSGGELQRVLIAFALLGQPQVLLFDEPTAGVDLSAEETIYTLLRQLQKRKKLTILLISHELGVVYKYANNVICLNKRKVCYGPPREILDKENLEKLYGEEMSFYPHQHV